MIESRAAVPRLEPRPWSRLTERARVDRVSDGDARRAMPLALIIAILAATSFAVVSRGDEQLDPQSLRLSLTLCAVGRGAELLSFNAARAAAGSIALIPFASAGLVAPNASSIVAVVAAELIVHLVHRRSWIKSSSIWRNSLSRYP